MAPNLDNVEVKVSLVCLQGRNQAVTLGITLVVENTD